MIERKPYTIRMSDQTRIRLERISERLRASKATAIQLAIDELWRRTLNKSNRDKYKEEEQ